MVPEEAVEPSRPEGHGILSDHCLCAPSTIIGEQPQQLPAQLSVSAGRPGARRYLCFHMVVDGSCKVPAKWHAALTAFCRGFLLPHWSQILVEPVQTLANLFSMRQIAMRGFVDHVLLLFLRRSEEAEEGDLRRL
jgi:hypothetical protein